MRLSLYTLRSIQRPTQTGKDRVRDEMPVEGEPTTRNAHAYWPVWITHLHNPFSLGRGYGWQPANQRPLDSRFRINGRTYSRGLQQDQKKKKTTMIIKDVNDVGSMSTRHDLLLPVIATDSLGVLEQMYGVGRYLYCKVLDPRIHPSSGDLDSAVEDSGRRRQVGKGEKSIHGRLRMFRRDYELGREKAYRHACYGVVLRN